jgi:possible ATP-dependent DNA helicase
MQSPSEVLNSANLTEQQKAVVTATEDFIRVKALAGTGKTYTAVQRVLYQKAIGREVSYVLTFTRSAADTISKRLVEAGVHDVPVRTLHSFAMEMVNDASENGEKVRVSDGKRPIKAMIYNLYGREARPREIEEVRQMATLLANGAVYSFMTSVSKDELKYLATRYQEVKEAAGELDWDDLIIGATEIAAELNITLDGEVIIDEAQDLTKIQLDFIEQLSPERVTLILDPNQSIFGFAGVEEAAMNAEGFTEYTLSKSFRTAQEILDVANELIADTLTSDITGGKVTWVNSSHGTQVEDVLKLLEPGDCVIGRFRSSARDVLMAIAPETDPEHPVNCKVSINDDDYTFGSIHWAKGQEWARVFILNLTENGFSGLPMTEEEKRILYVAITRAKKEVILLNLTDGKPRWLDHDK